MRYQKVDKGVRFIYDNSEGNTNTSDVFGEFVFTLADEADVYAVKASDFSVSGIEIQNGTAKYTSSNTAVIVK
jgi:hypothetical protein